MTTAEKKPPLSLHDACVLAERINARRYWRVIAIHESTSDDARNYIVRAHNCGVIFNFDTAPTDEDLDYLETYGM